MLNFYELMPKEYNMEGLDYKRKKETQINLPFRMLICGTTGSMKTTSALNIIKQIAGFTRIFIYAKDLTEPLYECLIDLLTEYEKKTQRKILTVSNNVKDIPKCDEFDKKESNLVICDDLITEKNLKNISDLFVRGRKKNISIMFITQSYYDTPTLIRKQLSHIVLKKINGKRDITAILSDNSLALNKEDIIKLYKYVMKSNQLNFFMIDLATNNQNLVFRQNFNGFHVSDE